MMRLLTERNDESVYLEFMSATERDAGYGHVARAESALIGPVAFSKGATLRVQTAPRPRTATLVP